MTPLYVRTIREKIFHTHREFADLLGILRGVETSHRTVEGWESGRYRNIPFYQTDVQAIERATQPRSRKCQARTNGPRSPYCRRRAIVRKGNRDLCAECATPKISGRPIKTVKTA